MHAGLVYGAAVADAVSLATEGLSQEQTRFHYTGDALSPGTRVRDHLRAHYAPNDWGPQADLMVGI